MTAMRTHFDVLVRGPTLAQALRQIRRQIRPADRSRLRVWTNWNEVTRQNGEQLFIVSCLRNMTSEPELSNVKHLAGISKRFLLFTGRQSIPAESMAQSLADLGVRGSERLHLVRREIDDEHSFLRRFVTGLLASDQDGAIMDAWWDADELMVISPLFQRLRVPVAALPKLRNALEADRANFKIDPFGDFIYWPSHDVHMSWPQFQQAVDPQARLRAQQRHEQFNQRYGRAIRSLRELHALSQQSVANLDERTVRRIEQGKTRATASALHKLAKAHGMTAADYMAAVADLLEARPSVAAGYVGNFRAAARKAS